MRVHTFGNTSSPAVATFGLRKTAEDGAATYGPETKNFVDRNFYVDDALKSVPTSSEAIHLLKNAKDMLQSANLRLHKIVSNNPSVVEAFDQIDRASDLKDLDLGHDIIPTQRSLGVFWDLATDTFTFKVKVGDKPFTKRGVLSVINGIFDPLGFAAPVCIMGKKLLRDMLVSPTPLDWDEPLPPSMYPTWEAWHNSLPSLSTVEVPRCYASFPSDNIEKRVLHIFCDASEWAIAAIAYIQTFDKQGHICVTPILGKAKLAPKSATTIPRLELCAAVLGVEIGDILNNALDIPIDETCFYSDSQAVLGYLSNTTRRFFVYVSNRVARVLSSSTASQWFFVPGENNPADLGTRSLEAHKLNESTWLKGPDSLFFNKNIHSNPVLVSERDASSDNRVLEDSSQMKHPCLDNDPEVRPIAKVYATKHIPSLGIHRFLRSSSWSGLVKGIASLKRLARSIKIGKNSNDTGVVAAVVMHHTRSLLSPADLQQSEFFIIKEIQHVCYNQEINDLEEGTPVHKSSSLSSLNPFLDEHGILRVGGRLKNSVGNFEEKMPIILPKNHHISTLLVREFHARVKHQGRHLTHGALRAGGFWIINGKKLVSNILARCVECCKLRRPLQEQKMADLPSERVTPSAPFTHVGVDVFGHWSIKTLKTRGGALQSKRWACIFCCFSTRAIHIEVLESMDTSCFMNALSRFFALRGPATSLYSDCGTNFVGACNEFREFYQVESNLKEVRSFLIKKGCTWTFNPPHASHMGGVWERLIGVCRRILYSILSQHNLHKLTHETLTTFLAEVVGIVNSRPLVPVSTDPECPFNLSPNTILTQKPPLLFEDSGSLNSRDSLSFQWKRVQHLSNQFWDRWKKEYLPLLQPRKKWHQGKQNLKVGDIVHMRDVALHRNQWPMGIVTKCYPSSDSLVRKVDIKLGSTRKIMTRPVQEIVLVLPKSDPPADEPIV